MSVNLGSFLQEQKKCCSLGSCRVMEELIEAAGKATGHLLLSVVKPHSEPAERRQRVETSDHVPQVWG